MLLAASSDQTTQHSFVSQTSRGGGQVGPHWAPETRCGAAERPPFPAPFPFLINMLQQMLTSPVSHSLTSLLLSPAVREAARIRAENGSRFHFSASPIIQSVRRVCDQTHPLERVPHARSSELLRKLEERMTGERGGTSIFYKLPHRRGQNESSSWQSAKRMVHASLWAGLTHGSWKPLAFMIYREFKSSLCHSQSLRRVSASQQTPPLRLPGQYWLPTLTPMNSARAESKADRRPPRGRG